MQIPIPCGFSAKLGALRGAGILRAPENAENPMPLLETPDCQFGTKSLDFELRGVDGKSRTLASCQGETGTVVMFLSNHCPFVQAINRNLAEDFRVLSELGVLGVAIMPNDTDNYPADSLSNMKQVATSHNYPFPYLIDETQAVARAYGAECTPDFFGYNDRLELQYRGRLDATTPSNPGIGAERELVNAMIQVVTTGVGPAVQHCSVGCSIKWKTA